MCGQGDKALTTTLGDPTVDSVSRSRLPSGLYAHKDRTGRVHYHYDFQAGGKRHLGWYGPISRAEAEKLLMERRALAARAATGLEPPDPPTVDKSFHQVAEEYIRSRFIKRRRAKTIQSLQYLLGVAGRYIGPRPLAIIQPKEIEAILADLAAPPDDREAWEPRSLVNLLNACSTVFAYGVPRGYTSRNPCQAVSRPNVEPKPTRRFRHLHPREDARLLGAFLRPMYRNATAIGLYLGARETPVISVRVEDVNLDDRAICVAGIFNKGRPRAGRDDLWLPIPRHLAPFLTDQYRRAREAGSPWLFPSPKDAQKHIFLSTLYKAFKRACLRAGFGPDPRFHDLRSVAETRLVASGAKALYERAKSDARLVAGHDSEQAAALYILPTVEYLRPVVDRYDDWLDEAAAADRPGSATTPDRPGHER